MGKYYEDLDTLIELIKKIDKKKFKKFTLKKNFFKKIKDRSKVIKG